MPKLDLSKTQSERSKIHLFIKESLETLSDTDRNIPQLKFIISLLERGVGVHHSGLLPIIKEIVCIM